MKKVLLSSVCIILSVLFCVTESKAQTAINPFTWSVSGSSTAVATDSSSFMLSPAQTTPGSSTIYVSAWRRNTGLTATTGTSCYNTSNWELGGSLASAQTNGKYIYFSISTNPGVELIVRNVVLQSQVSATGPSSCQLTYNAGAGDVNFGTTATGYATATPITLAFTAATPVHICAGSTVTFKLFAWGATNVAGTLRINDNSGMNDSFYNAVSATASITPNTVCAGTNVTFTGGRTGGTGTYTYAWAGPGTLITTSSRNPQIFGAGTGATGIYTFTVTDSWGCTSTDTTMLTVNAAPSTPSISPSTTQTRCMGDSVVFTTPVVSGYTYQWDSIPPAGPPVAIPGATNATYTTYRAGRFFVIVRNAAGCSAFSSSVRVIFNPAAPPTVTYTSLSFCTGGSATLTAASGTGYTYQWYDGATAISGATNVSYTATTSGAYSVRVTVPTGCVTTSATYNVVEVTLPTIYTTDTTAFCAGGSAVLRVSISSAATGVQYQWKLNSVNIPGATNNTYVATTSGVYTCFINIPGSCTLTTNTIVITVHPLPSPVITFNHATNVFSTFSYYTRYQWYINTVTIPGATNRTVTAYSNASYRVMVTDTFGCVRLSDPYGLYNLAVNNVAELADINIYPNPATDIVHIETAAEITATISSVEGKIVMGNIREKDISLSSLPMGLYMLAVYDSQGNRLRVEKLIKQ